MITILGKEKLINGISKICNINRNDRKKRKRKKNDYFQQIKNLTHLKFHTPIKFLNDNQSLMKAYVSIKLTFFVHPSACNNNSCSICRSAFNHLSITVYQFSLDPLRIPSQ